MPDNFQTLPSVTPAAAIAAQGRGTQMLDVRKAPARRASGKGIEYAEWVDPFDLDHSHPLMSSDVPLAVFCAHGHEVSQFACALLRFHGCDAVFVVGGFEALVQVGAPVTPLPLTELSP
ncbi:MAG: sulfurtransferase [Pseudomonadota bacterium]